MKVATVDATEERNLRAEFQVAGFPTFKLFKGGKRNQPTEFRGEREAEVIVEWMRQKAGPSAIFLEDAVAAAAFLAAHPVAAIGFFRDGLDKDAQLFHEVADSDTLNVAMALTDRRELFEKYNVTGEMVCLFRKDSSSEPRVDFRVNEALGGLDGEELTHFLAVQSLELVVEYTRESSPRIFEAKIPNHLLLFLNKTEASQRELLGGFRDAAAPFRGQVLFIVADVSGEGAGLLHFFGLQAGEAPAACFIHVGTSTKYRLAATEGLAAPSLRAFCQAVLEGRVEPYLMSQDGPQDWDRRPVKVLVGKNFAQVAFDEGKDVFVKFYAPWCPHSKAMAAAWEELGEKYQNHEDVVIAEMDATTNEVAEIAIRAYPTLYYFPMGQGRKMIEYKGPRDLASFTQFLESKGELPAQVALEDPKAPSQEPAKNDSGPSERREEL
ncbi:hypothetical protein JRQ81_010450 [Phrynocephalus forsythii]|uniref:protein disulfide-isomerase n=1 Tax=Phrynocephalus forsythii TaxID=171643 RepID=A0A9Q0XBW7_9SAUR|nr:hypothetical protein JRQ81_010450 [Phrynocephalus forsythii]